MLLSYLLQRAHTVFAYYLRGALSEAGVQESHFVRWGKGAQYQNGVTIDVLDERKGHLKNNLISYAIQCVEEVSPADGYERIIVPTNSYPVEEAMRTLVPCAGEATFLIFAANWDGTETIDQIVPRERWVIPMAEARFVMASTGRISAQNPLWVYWQGSRWNSTADRDSL